MSQVTLKQVADRAGVSRQAAGAILGNSGHLFREATRAKVLEAARELGYRPNSTARAMLSKRTRHVGVVVINNPEDPVTFPQTYYFILGLNMALEQAGYLLTMVRLGDVRQEGLTGSRAFRERALDGVVVTTVIPDELHGTLEAMSEVCVWADTNRWVPTMCVQRDEVAAGREAGEAVAAMGFKRVLWLGPAEDEILSYSHEGRRRGLAAACRTAGIELTRVGLGWSWKPEKLLQVAPFLSPDVAIVATDVHRVRIAGQAAMACRRVPGVDFGLVCCESVPDLTNSWPELACVEFDRFDLGRRAAGMMLARLEHGVETESQRQGVKFRPGTTLRQRPV